MNMNMTCQMHPRSKLCALEVLDQDLTGHRPHEVESSKALRVVIGFYGVLCSRRDLYGIMGLCIRIREVF